jgi:hypothetical protein
MCFKDYGKWAIPGGIQPIKIHTVEKNYDGVLNPF